MSLTQDIHTIKQQYREWFAEAHNRLLERFRTLRDEYTCPHCPTPPEDVKAVCHPDCGYLAWQKRVVYELENTVAKEICEMLATIQGEREIQGSCHQCGVCCRLASSEFDYPTLLEKARQGDPFARQFTGVFVPYPSADTAERQFPEIVSEIRTQTEGPVSFYHCLYLSQDNRCTLYGDPRRPAICASYPETPLILMYPRCGYQPWKTAMLPDTLLAHATLELCQHYAHTLLEHIKQVTTPPQADSEEIAPLPNVGEEQP